MASDAIEAVEKNLKPSVSRRLREVVSDAFAFVRSAEANQALATITLDDLINDQIKRNGETALSNAAQYNPYSHDPKEDGAAGGEPAERANFLGGSDTGQPTKLDRVFALQNELTAVITEIKAMEPIEVADAEEYAEAAEVSAPEE
jgi:hypothetical protein